VYGGHELSIADMTRIVRIFSAACPSTGWIAAFYMGRAIAAETLLDAYVARHLARRPGHRDVSDRAEMKLKGAFITDLCRNAMNDIVRGIGGDGFRDHSPL